MAKQATEEKAERLPLRYSARDGGVIVIPDWSDRVLYLQILHFLHNSPDYVLLDRETYTVPRISRGLSSKNPGNAGPTIRELAGAYGKSAIRRASKMAETGDASIVLLQSTRGFSQLEISALFFGRTKSDEAGGGLR